MASILAFTKNIGQTINNKHEKSLFRPPSLQKIYLCNFKPEKKETFNLDFDNYFLSCSYMDSPPQMPVLLKYMYNLGILRADFTTFVPSYTPI